MAPSKPPTPSRLKELREFTANISDLPYDKLMPAAAEAGWSYRLIEKEVWADGGNMVVRFDVQVGLEGQMEDFDTVTVKVGAAPGPVSTVARHMAIGSLPFLFFGRLPPAPPVVAPEKTAQEQVNIDMSRIDMSRATTKAVVNGPPETSDGGEYVEPEPERIQVVARREPDGLPIFVDLYAPQYTGKTRALVESVLDEIDDFFAKASAVEQIDALPVKNPELFNFLRDVGTPDDVNWLRGAATSRKTELAPAVLATTAPRRRTSATAH